MRYVSKEVATSRGWRRSLQFWTSHRIGRRSLRFRIEILSDDEPLVDEGFVFDNRCSGTIARIHEHTCMYIVCFCNFLRKSYSFTVLHRTRQTSRTEWRIHCAFAFDCPRCNRGRYDFREFRLIESKRLFLFISSSSSPSSLSPSSLLFGVGHSRPIRPHSSRSASPTHTAPAAVFNRTQPSVFRFHLLLFPSTSVFITASHTLTVSVYSLSSCSLLSLYQY